MSISSFSDRYWNLAQAAAWVVYREKDLVDQMKNATRHSLEAVSLYPSMWPSGREKVGKLEELHKKLIGGKLNAMGYAQADQNSIADIPASIWPDLVLRPPCAFDGRKLATCHEPWTDIRVESAIVKTLWRGLDERSGRKVYDGGEIKKIFEECSATNPSLSQSRQIGLAQDEYSKRHGANIRPSITTVKRFIPK